MRVPTQHFEDGYAHDPDPWRFATSFWEQRRYDITAAALPRPRFTRAFEPACAIGELTARLASRCDEVVAMDCSTTVLDEARRRHPQSPNVTFVLGAIPEQWPAGRFDLVMLSEVGYYFTPDLLEAVADRAIASLTPDDGVLMAVHWLGTSDHHLLHGDDVHEVLGRAALPHLRHGGGYRDDRFRLDWWERA